MKNFRITMLFSIILLSSALLAACGQSSVEIGMVETNLPGDWRASYSTFTGEKIDTFRVEDQELMILEYDVEVTKGALSLQVENPDDRVIWDVTLDGDQADTARVQLDQAGSFDLVIQGDDAGGSWDLDWEIE